MFDISEFISANNVDTKPIYKVSNKVFLYRDHRKSFNLNGIKSIIDFVKKLPMKLPIVFDLQGGEFEDKLSYVLLECLCFYLKDKFKIPIKIIYKQPIKIGIEGIVSSPLGLLSTFNLSNQRKFPEKFESELYHQHFRRLLKKEDDIDHTLVSKLMGDVECFMRNFNVNAECVSEISEVISELADNALEHSRSDCLVDVDIAPNYKKQDDLTGDSFYGVNIVILSYSPVLIGDDIEKMMSVVDASNKWYNKLKCALKIHEKFWDETYTKRDFFIMSAFQHKISTRSSKYTTGGTGLTKLIAALESRSHAYNCYLLSGNRILNFQNEHLELDEDEWVGFNIQNDFVKFPPDKTATQSSPVFFPGVAYNLNFILKEDANENV